MTAVSTTSYKPHNIAVIALRFPDGKGDVATGSGIAKLVAKILPKDEIVFTYTDFQKGSIYDQYLKNMPVVEITAQDEKEWNVTPLVKIMERIRKHQFKFILMSSTYDDRLIPNEIRFSGTKIIKFREYGSEWDGDLSYNKPPVYRLGLAPGENGVLFPFELYQTYIPSEHFKKIRAYTAPIKLEASNLVMEYLGFAEDSSLARLQHLRELPKPLVSTILGPHGCLEADFNAAVGKFNANSRLYYGYGHTAMMCCFIAAVCKSDQNTDNANITICFLNKFPAQFELSSGQFAAFERNIHKKVLRENRFNSVVIYDKNIKGELNLVQKIEITETKGKRALTLIFHSLPPEQVPLLARSCERETYSTGDSSFLKTLALDQVSAHEVRKNKKDFIDSFIALAKKRDPALGEIFYNGFYGGKEGEDRHNQNIELSPEAIAEGMYNLFKAMRSKPKLRKQLTALIKDIAYNRDLGLFLPKILKTHLNATSN